MNPTHALRMRRQTIRRSDAQTRWDQADQHLLQWAIDRAGVCLRQLCREEEEGGEGKAGSSLHVAHVPS